MICRMDFDMFFGILEFCIFENALISGIFGVWSGFLQ